MKVIGVKGKRVLFSINKVENNSLATDSLVTSIDNPETQVKIIKVRGSRAIGQVVKGTVLANSTFQISVVESPKSSIHYGVLAGASINTMSAKLSPSQTLKLAGTSFNFLFLADYSLYERLNLRLLAGYDSFRASASDLACGTCMVSLNYLSFHGLPQYELIHFDNGSSFWLGAGLGFLLSTASSSNVINTNSLKNNSVFIVGTGLNYKLSPKIEIPIQLDSFIYPGGDVQLQQINLRVGLRY